MHGVPLDLAMNADQNQLQVLQEIVYREEKDRFNMNASSTSLGVWGDGKNK